MFSEHHPVHLTIDSDVEVSMIRTYFANYISASIKRMAQRALQVDRVTPLESVRKVELCLKRRGPQYSA